MGRFIDAATGDFPDQLDTLVVNLTDPLNDAGSVSDLVRSELLTLDTVRAARIDVDPLLDYRAQRPRVNYINGELVGLFRPAIDLYIVRDMEGRPFLLLTGTEPDFYWDTFAADLVDTLHYFGIKRVFSVGSIPAGLPHTRQPDMLVRSHNREKVAPALQANVWYSASFSDFFEYNIAQFGMESVALTVRVPVYLTGNRYSAGAVSGLSMLASVSGFSFPLGDLEVSAREENEALETMMKQNEQLREIVTAFEEEYDKSDADPGLVQAPRTSADVPSVEEIGRAAEQFLAQYEASKQKDQARAGEDTEFESLGGIAEQLEAFRRARGYRTGPSPRASAASRGQWPAVNLNHAEDAGITYSAPAAGDGQFVARQFPLPPGMVQRGQAQFPGSSQGYDADGAPQVQTGPENAPTAGDAGTARPVLSTAADHPAAGTEQTVAGDNLPAEDTGQAASSPQGEEATAAETPADEEPNNGTVEEPTNGTAYDAENSSETDPGQQPRRGRHAAD
ncbi:PAC2 family protein [Actinobaculum suis]|uniref:PAC2 family protein n=1 Tax=Actinobaculum suis TaxID=1657 RepID=A0A1G6ZCL8_9ACTO|nr:PAC2 family protein [Actinobaculum suis]MDY5153892.1 PAC2 family protein [Actinobaculum suis]SDE00434.1 PAC2 family protein [Actinobaculum suis]